MNWRDIAKKLRAYAPPELLSEFEVPDGASDSELVDAVFKKVPEFRQASGVDENDLKADIQKWGQLRADREQARLLGGAARDTRRAFQAGTELGSFPLNEGLRAAGKIGPEENLSDVASEVAGGGAKGAAAGAITSVLTDPTSLIGMGAATRLGAAAKASPQAAKALSGVVLGALAGQNYQLYKVGLEEGFTSPAFEAAAVAANAGLATGAVLGNPRAVIEGGRGLVREGLVKTLDRTPMAPGRVTPPLEVVDRNPIAFLGEPSAPPVSNAARLKALKDAEIYAKARAGIGESRARAEAARLEAEFQDATNPLAALGEPVERRSMSGAMAPVDLVTSPERAQALKNAEIYAKARAERRAMDIGRQRDLEEAFSGVDPDAVALKSEILGQSTPPKPKPPQKSLFAAAGKDNISELTPAELEARAVALKALERDVMDVDSLTPDTPTVKRIGDTPRAYEHGIPEDRLPIVDNTIAGIEADVDMLRQAPKSPTLYQRVKDLGKIHFEDFKAATGLESKDIPAKYKDMFRHSGERNFDRIIQTLGQESWYDVDGGHNTNATERFWEDVSSQISGDDVFGPGDPAHVEARNRIEGIANRVGVSRGKLMEALQKRDGNAIERRFNQVIAENDPYDIDGQMMASENPDSPPEFGGEDGFDPTTFEDDGYGNMSLKKPRKPRTQAEIMRDIQKVKDAIAFGSGSPARKPAPYSRNPEVNAAVDRIGGPQVARDLGLQWNSVTAGPKAEKLPGVTENQIRGLNAEMLADPTIRTFDETPPPVAGIPPEAVAIGRVHGFGSREFRAAIKAAAPPPPVAPVGAGEAAKPGRLAPYDASREIYLENESSRGRDLRALGLPEAASDDAIASAVRRSMPKADKKAVDAEIARLQAPAGRLGKAAHLGRQAVAWARSIVGNEVSNLKQAGMHKTAELMNAVATGMDTSLVKAEAALSKMDFAGLTKETLEGRAELMETGSIKQKPDETDSSFAARKANVEALEKVVPDELMRTLQTVQKRDPMNAAPFEAGYHPRKGTMYEPPVSRDDQLSRPLEFAGQNRAPSLHKSRSMKLSDKDAEVFTKPITDPDEFRSLIRRRARSAGVLEHGATMERTPENYPRTWDKILAHETNEMRKTARLKKGDPLPDKLREKAKGIAKEKFEQIQLPDLYEAVATDRPDDSWTQILNNKHAVDASNVVLKGVDPLHPVARAVTDIGTGVSSTMLLGNASPTNVLGLSSVPLFAMDAVKNAGGGTARQLAHGATSFIRALGLTANATAEEISAVVKRRFGQNVLSRGAEEFGPVNTKNPVRAAIGVTDRIVRTATADALEKYIPDMDPASLVSLDRTLTMRDPENIAAARRELANTSQGAGNSARVLHHEPGSKWGATRNLVTMFSGPTLRQIETVLPRINSTAKLLAFMGAGMTAGEIALDLKGLLTGKGVNLPGGEETEDQKALADHGMDWAVKQLQTSVSSDRSPVPWKRAVQNMATALPGGREIAQLGGYGELPFVGDATVSVKDSLLRAVRLARKTGDYSSLLGIARGPGLGPEWFKVVVLADAQKHAMAKDGSAGDVGIGQSPQNSGWPTKLTALAQGNATPEDLARSLVRARSFRQDEEANQYRAKMNEKAEAKRRKEEAKAK